MRWTSHKLRRGNLELAYKAAGEGPGLIVCLHGYGQDRHAFDAVLEGLRPGWRVICADLPGFGESRWLEEGRLDPADLFALVEEAERLAPVRHLALAGYSLGGKTALGMVMDAPRQVDAVLLLAADGLRVHPVYRFCVYHPVGRTLFRFTLRYPWGLLLMLRALIFLKLGDSFRYRLALRQLGDKASRRRLWQVWDGYAGFGPDRERVREADARWRPKWLILWGKHDTVVPPQFGAEFAAWLPGVALTTLPCGHLLLRDSAGEVGRHINTLLSEL